MCLYQSIPQPIPTKPQLDQWVTAIRERGLTPVGCNMYSSHMESVATVVCESTPHGHSESDAMQRGRPDAARLRRELVDMREGLSSVREGALCYRRDGANVSLYRLMTNLIARLVNSPAPFLNRIRWLVYKLGLGSYSFRLAIGAVDRSHYGYLLFHSAQLAKKLGYARISAIEYGVAGGRGLLALEKHAEEIERLFGVGIDIYGFDTGEGLPTPKDYRDLPYHWKQGFFAMNQGDLRGRLRRAKLILGNIEETATSFFEKFKPAPIGAIIHDFDFHSSTATALKMLNAGHEYYLPRIYSYFDDVLGTEIELYNDYTGERLAIREFNAANHDIKLCQPYYFHLRRPESWHQQIWIGHFFNHPRYNSFVSDEVQQLGLP